MDCAGRNRIRIAALEDDLEVLLTGELAANLIAHFKERDIHIFYLLDLVHVCLETHHAANLKWLQSCHNTLVDVDKAMRMTDEEPILPTYLVRKPRYKAPGIVCLAGNGRHSV